MCITVAEYWNVIREMGSCYYVCVQSAFHVLTFYKVRIYYFIIIQNELILLI